ncbi:MAG: hypothetical protein D6768_06395, partial [Chloroflexi bacterium]
MNRDHQPNETPEDESPVSASSRQTASGASRVDAAHLKSKHERPVGAVKKNAGKRKTPPASPAKRRTGITIRSTPPGKHDGWWWGGGFLFGFAVGLALSLTYGWVLDPRPLPVTPANLRAEDQAFYVRLIALAFAHDENLARAQARLATLDNPNVVESVVALTEKYIEQEEDVRDIKALVALSGALGKTSSAMAAFIVTPTPLPTATFTPAPTPTPRPTQT